jgi:hypothetical protein
MSIFTWKNDTVELDENNNPTLNINQEELINSTLQLLGDIFGSGLSDLATKYNELVKENRMLKTKLENLSEVRDMQSKRLATLTTAENDANTYKKKYSTIKKKNEELQGKYNQALEKIKNYEFKFSNVKTCLQTLTNQSTKVMDAFTEVNNIMHCTGRVVEKTIGDYKIAKVPLNYNGHNRTNIKMASAGIPVSLTHNYCYVVESPGEGQQYFYASENADKLITADKVSIDTPEIREYILDQFKGVSEAVFDGKDDDNDFTLINQKWKQVIDQTNTVINDITKNLKFN